MRLSHVLSGSMFVWFVATAVAAVWFVFRDERFDFRLLVLGALAPDVLDGAAGGMWIGHSVLTPMALMGLVMALTRGRRETRRAWLGVPIGMFLHLVFDGAFASAESFWWPVTGLSGPGSAVPVLERGWWNVPLEIAGLVLGGVLWQMFGLSDPARRKQLVRTGTVRGSGAGGAGKC